MNIQGLIERYEKFKASKKKLTSVDLVLKDLRSLDEPGPLPFKLKDVVGRIRGFDPTTQTRWLNDILKELGGDYGRMKYRDGYEQGLLEGLWIGRQLINADKIRQELNKPVIPQFVADWIEECKNDDFHLFGAMEAISLNQKKLDYWFREDDNMELFARAWLDGYEVEEEKRYIIKLKGVPDGAKFLKYAKVTQEWYFGMKEFYSDREIIHTRKELEEAGFGWVFDCEGIEIEEVTE